MIKGFYRIEIIRKNLIQSIIEFIANKYQPEKVDPSQKNQKRIAGFDKSIAKGNSAKADRIKRNDQ